MPHYVNIALNQQSHIDYILGSSECDFSDFVVIDPDINFSDHLPLFATFKCSCFPTLKRVEVMMKLWVCLNSVFHDGIKQTAVVTINTLVPLITRLDEMLCGNDISNTTLDELYEDIVYC